MRILIATTHRNVVGGVEKYLQRVLPSLANRGHRVALLYETRFDSARERIDPALLELPSSGLDESGAEAGLRFAEEWRPDVVYSQGLQSSDFQAALLSKHPTALFAHNYVGTCASEEKCHAFPNPRPCDRLFGPACLALYYPRRCGGLNPVTMWKLYQRSADNNAQLGKYAAILVASSHMRREYERHGVRPEKIHLTPLPNPLEDEGFHEFKRTPMRGKLLFLGRLTRLKGAAELLRAIPLAEKRMSRPLTVTIAGEGPQHDRLEDFARRNGLKAEFAGWVGSARKTELITQSDLLVVPSLWAEPFGLVGLEAGGYGLPAVAYDVGGISDWLIPGYSGELAPAPPTIQGLAAAIYRALSDSAHYAKLCYGAREVANRFTLAAHVSKLESTLETVLEMSRHTRSLARRGEENVHAPA